MLVAIDIGNTQTVIGVFAGSAGRADSAGRVDSTGRGAGAQLEHSWRIATVESRTGDELALMISQLFALDGLDARKVISGFSVASVVPRLRTAMRQMADRWFEVPMVTIEPGIRTGMPILYDNPREVGADRIADAVAAFEAYGGPTIVIDFGTATTFEVVSEKGEYLGGVILPGIEISLEALFGRAALLPRVELVEPRSVLGKNTVESLQSGAIYGFAAQVDGLCERLADEVGPCTVVATGGLAGLIGPASKAIDHHAPNLTLDGLRIIYERNQA